MKLQFGKTRIDLNSAARILLVLIAIFALGNGLYSLGYRSGTERPKTVVVKGITNVGDSDVAADFGVFWEAWKTLEDTYYDPTAFADAQKRVYGAISGMVETLGDENTQFLPPEESKQFTANVSGEFGGIGAEIGEGEVGGKNVGIVVITPLEGSPAQRAGLMPKDRIRKVDDWDTDGNTVQDAVARIRGPLGTSVVLTILRDGWTEPRPFTITRETIKIPATKLTMKEGGIAHLQLLNFNANTPAAFLQAVLKAASLGTNGLVLDLRNNPGGFLNVAVDIAGWFLEDGSVVVTEQFGSKGTESQVFRANGNEALFKIPTVVLINGGSASASEILAGALRHYRKSDGLKLIGEKTFGKGTVQELQPLSDDSKLKVTVAQWLLPDGSEIHKKGIVPDIEVKFAEEDVKAGKDPQLEKAIEILAQELTKVAAR